MAAIEVRKSATAWLYSNFNTTMWEFANFLHDSAHFTIIDSYSSSKGRYKGDPLEGGTPFWTGSGDIGLYREWIVFECQTSIHPGLGTTLPKWQAKLEFHCWTNLYDISDPTGIYYTNDPQWYYDGYCRVSPWGGWDSADSQPDFRPAGQPYPASFDNNGWGLDHGGSGNDTRWYMIACDGTLITFSRRNQNAYDIMGLGGYIGDVRPIKAGNLPNPRAQIQSGTTVCAVQGVGGGYFLAEESYLSGTYALMGFVDHLGVKRNNKQWRIPTGWFLHRDGKAVPNGQSPTFEIDTYPVVPCPTDERGVWFDLPFLRKGWGVGAALIANKTWLSTGPGYGLYFPWDGSTTLI